MEECADRVRYWEKELQGCEADSFYKKSYKRQVDIWLSRFEVYRCLWKGGE